MELARFLIADDLADLRSRIGVIDEFALLKGSSAIGDSNMGWFYWDITATGADDGVDTIAPEVSGTDINRGRWIRSINTATPMAALFASPPAIGGTTAAAITGTAVVVTTLNTITTTELAVLDGATKGAGVASKAVVLDSAGNFNMADGDFFRLSADTLAAAGTSASNAAAVVDQITIITGADGANGVVVVAAADLGEYEFFNDSPCYAAKIYPVNSGNDVINELASNEAFILGPRQHVKLKAISATQWYAPKAASLPATETDFEIFDDFLYATFDETDNWISFEGSAATAAVVVTAPEGKINLVNGATPGADDGVSLSLILLTKGSLVSLGKTVFECRVSSSVITGCNMTFGLSDKLAEGNEHGLYTISGTTISDGGLTLANAAGFVFDKDATASTVWHTVTENATSIASLTSASAGPTVNTYQILRIEIDATGDARFYIDGVLEKTVATAVATSALLVPFVSVDEAGTQAANTLSIDYIKFSGARPSSNA